MLRSSTANLAWMILTLGMILPRLESFGFLWLTHHISFYNQTKYSGLEIHISNSYANSLLQIMHFTPLIRNLALQHAATACVSDVCLLCELGFLFDMLQKAEGSICQATNMLKTLSNHPQGETQLPLVSQSFVLFFFLLTVLLAAPLGLLEEDSHGSSLNVMLQGLTRFLLERIAADYKTMAPASSSMEQVHINSSLICEMPSSQNRPSRPWLPQQLALLDV